LCPYGPGAEEALRDIVESAEANDTVGGAFFASPGWRRFLSVRPLALEKPWAARWRARAC
jgi:hypothetical protein